MIAFRKNARFRKQIFTRVGFRPYKGNTSMVRISLGSLLLLIAFGLAAGCSSMSTSRFNLFNHNKARPDGCVDVGAGPICEGPVMGGAERLPPESGIMLPSDGGLMPGNMLPVPATTTGPILPGSPTPVGPGLQGTGAPPINSIMPPATGSSTAPPGRLVPTPPGVKTMPYTPPQ
jgi:hypothetical protein